MDELRAAEANWQVHTSQELPVCTVIVQDEPPQKGEEEKESPDMSTADLLDRLEKARILGKDDKILIAERLLRGVDHCHLKAIHFNILREAALFQSLLRDNAASLDGWVKQGKHTGRHNFSIHYKLNESAHGRDLSCRLETVIPSDLLVPIISVLNESELYSSWLPNWTAPKLRVVTSEKIQQTGRCSQIVNLVIEVPWPLAKRQVILKAVACDDIDSHPNEGDGNETGRPSRSGGRIFIRIQSLDDSNREGERWEIHSADNSAVQVKVRGGFTIEKCPADHSMKEYALQYHERIGEASVSSLLRGDLVLVTFSFCVDAHLSGVPKSFVDFFIRNAIGKMWNMFLNVAEEVKNGERKSHSDAIATKRALYDWVEERTRVMLGQI